MAQVVRLVGRRRDPEGTYEAIVAAARTMMAERGPEALTVSDVAHRAQVNRTTAYQHFRSRDDLVGAVMARLADETSRMLTADMPPGDRIDHMVEYFSQHPEIARLWMFQMLANIQLPNRDGWNRYMKAMRSLAVSERTQDGIDPEMLGHILLAAILVWSLRARSGPKGEAGATEMTRRFTSELKRLLLFGVMRPERWPELVATDECNREPTSRSGPPPREDGPPNVGAKEEVMTKLNYTYDEIMAERDYATRLRRGDVLFHGGLDAHGRYIPPRSRHRLDAIAAWTEQLAAAGQPTQVMRFEQLDMRFFPNVAQTKVLLRHGARGAMTRILTLIGITEGFGNDGIRATPRPELQPFFKDSIANTCLDHLYRGVMEAHGNDEAGRGNEAGHDVMWYAIRDAALNNPTITPDMFENLPVAPPPGYSGPAKPSPEAIGVAEMKLLFPTLDPMFEILLSVFAQILFIELIAFGTFAWAKEVLSDRQCSAAPEFAPNMVDYIQADESIHVGYLQCALAETRCRTLVGSDGNELSGTTVVDAICQKILGAQTGARRERMLAYRMKQIRDELAARPDGAKILADFEQLGSVPAIAA